MVSHARDEGVLVMPGMGGVIDGIREDHIWISSPCIFNETTMAQLVKALETAIQKVLAEIKTP